MHFHIKKPKIDEILEKCPIPIGSRRCGFKFNTRPPDLWPTDFYLFSKLKECLRSNKFNTDEKTAVIKSCCVLERVQLCKNVLKISVFMRAVVR